ncbi:hypothetical protein DL93DRAFT_2069918 [Clavulina sp. PMI_390]|nr:hypothetical protein DL93DRAFT_2069918 [Clavulina sp. PMI_390]
MDNYDLEPPEEDDVQYYNISSQEWQSMIITSPDGRVQYITESSRSRWRDKKHTTVITKVDGAGIANLNAPTANQAVTLAKRVIARFEFRTPPAENVLVYGFTDHVLEDFFPPLQWPEGFRRVQPKESEGWKWVGILGEPTLMDKDNLLVAYYCPNPKKGSKGVNGKLAVFGELSPETVDLVVVGFILAMRDADKLFGHIGPDVSPRPGFGGATWMSVGYRGENRVRAYRSVGSMGYQGLALPSY